MAKRLSPSFPKSQNQFTKRESPRYDSTPPEDTKRKRTYSSGADDETPIPKKSARSNGLGSTHKQISTSAEKETTHVGRKKKNPNAEEVEIQKWNEREWPKLLSQVAHENLEIIENGDFFNQLTEPDILAFFEEQNLETLDVFLKSHRIPIGRFYTTKYRKAHRCTQAIMAHREHYHRSRDPPNSRSSQDGRPTPPSLQTHMPKAAKKHGYSDDWPSKYVAAPAPRQVRLTISPEAEDKEFDMGNMHRRSWPDRYTVYDSPVPLWAFDEPPNQNNVREYTEDSVRGCVRFLDGGEKILRLRNWGRQGWQNGWINRLRSEMDQRQMHFITDSKGERIFDLCDNFAHSEERPRPSGERQYRRASQFDPTGDLDEEAWQSTLMLLTYELEAAAQRFGGQMLLAVEDRIDLIQSKLHLRDGGHMENNEGFVDPGVGPGYQKIRKFKPKAAQKTVPKPSSEITQEHRRSPRRSRRSTSKTESEAE